MKRHIIFDFDDTISGAYELNQQLFVDTFLPYKPDIDQDYVRKLHYQRRGTSMKLQFEEVIKKFKMEISSEKLVQENELLHQKRAAEVKIFGGFKEIVSHFEKLDKVISICTNRSRGSLEIILRKNKLDKYLDNIISCSDAGYEKPDPFCLIELLKKYSDISKEETIYFGDSKTDAEFASNADIDFIIIDHYLNKKQFYTTILNSFVVTEDELLTEIDKDNKEIGGIYRMEAHVDPSKYHRAVHIMLFNSKGEVVLQQRSHNKMYDPDKWDMPGGHQLYGQNIELTAESELMEEMGIKSGLKFVRVGIKKTSKQSEYYYLFYTIHDGPYKFDKHEVQCVKAFDCQRLLDNEYDNDFQILSHVYDYVKELKSVWGKPQ